MAILANPTCFYPYSHPRPPGLHRSKQGLSFPHAHPANLKIPAVLCITDTARLPQFHHPLSPCRSLSSNQC